MAISIKGKVAIVTGAGRGIGKGIARVFARDGAKVVVANRSEKEGNSTVRQITRARGKAIFIKTDVRSEGDIKNLIAETRKRFGRIDILCHNAGIYPDSPIDKMPVSMWDDVMDTNLKSAFLLTKAVAPIMKKQRKGRILFTSSITGPSVGFGTLAHYGATKGGLNAFVRSAALEYAKYGITVNTVSPGTVLTENVKALLGPEGIKETAKVIPVGGIGKVEDIAHAMLFFASDEAGYVTGRDMVVDGGQILPESPEAF
ncbi:MAG: SDR family NAD(P)-dependent oxidoreductase [Alphaproteobacteria bacterium]